MSRGEIEGANERRAGDYRIPFVAIVSAGEGIKER